MNPIEALKSSATYYVAVPGGMVFELRRVRTADLVQVGFAELAGQAEVRTALAEVQETLRQAGDPDGMTDEEIAKMERDRAHDQKMALERFQQVLGASPERQKAWSARVDAYCCAGITGLAYLRDGLEVGTDDESDDDTEDARSKGLVSPYSEVSREDLRDLTPCTFVRRESDADPEGNPGDPPKLWIGIVHPTHRTVIQGLISRMNGVATLARPFRRKSSLSAAGVQGGQQVR